MNKTPLIAIIVSIIAVVSIYIFVKNIKPPKNNTTEANTKQEVVENQEIISTFNKTLAPEIQQNLNRWLAD
ncbi:MAG: hypothetical protein R2836_01625 [Chitinophagales bacterium]